MLDSGHDAADDRLDLLMAERGRLTGVAYRLLGSLADAEDVVQETYARWYGLTEAQRAAVDSPAAWLTTVASRLCLDQLRSARVRRERYVGEWIPEPVPGGAERFGGHAAPVVEHGDPAEKIGLDESVTMAFLVVLDAMTPAERVAFVLHDVFGYSFSEIADVVDRTPAACRQLASVARRRLREAAPGGPDPATATAEVVRDLRDAWERKDVAALVGLLDARVTSLADSGGMVPVFAHVAQGAEEVARGLLTVIEHNPDLRVAEEVVNGRPGLVGRVGGRVVSVVALDVVDGRVRTIWTVRNPDKLAVWA